MNSKVGGGLLVDHSNGVVISTRTKIADHAVGAKILGNVVVGDDVEIGVNTIYDRRYS